jgi:hypothetical protein
VVRSQRSGAFCGHNSCSKENRSGAGAGLQGSRRLVLLSFASILELMLFGVVASYLVSFNVHIVGMADIYICISLCFNLEWNESTLVIQIV